MLVRLEGMSDLDLVDFCSHVWHLRRVDRAIRVQLEVGLKMVSSKISVPHAFCLGMPALAALVVFLGFAPTYYPS